MSVDRFFPEAYAQSRDQFLQSVERIESLWGEVRTGIHHVGESSDDIIDWIQADARIEKERMLIVTTGLHGIEGLVGAAMVQLFLEEILPEIEPEKSGLLIVHAINPYGMRTGRKVNVNNVDLNRNFLYEDGAYAKEHNRDYTVLDRLLNPSRPLRWGWLETLTLPIRFLRSLFSMGPRRGFEAMLLGQYRHTKGVYFGGREEQEETRLLKDLVQEAAAGYSQIVLLDMHTGYGPADQMSLVNSVLEAMSSEETRDHYGYPVVLAADPTEFYSIKGDMIDYFYRWFGDNCPETRFYGVAFEFGTLGDSIPALFRSLRAIVWENQLHHHGTTRKRMEGKVREEFAALYAPGESRWRMKAVYDARQAFRGILGAEGFLRTPTT